MRRIALLTPYGKATHKGFLSFFRSGGFEIAADATFDLDSDATISELTPEALVRAARSLVAKPGVEAIFVSCTATPIVPLIEDIERAVGIPVISSSQAMAWDILRLVGYGDPVEGFGSLLRSKNQAPR